jgi:type I restriction enzyme S subunit
MSELPKGWALATLPDLVGRDGVFVDGDWVESKDQDPNGDVRLIQLADVGDGHYVDKSNRFMTSAAAAALGCTDLKVGDVLIARMPDPLGRACQFPGDKKRAVTVVDVAIFRSDAGTVNHRWLMHAVNAHQTRAAIASLASGTTRTRISRGNLGTIDFPLPPLNEQRRIVEKLDAVFEKSRAAKARLERLPALLDRLKRSILAAAFRGDLTKEWRVAHPDVEPASVLLERIRAERRRRWEEGLRAKGKDPRKATYEEPAPVDVSGLPELPEGWGWTTMRELAATERHALAIGPFGSSLKVDDYRERGVPLIFVRNVRAKNYTELKPAFIDDDKARELAAHQVVSGDVLVTKMGDPPGDADVYPPGLAPAVITADVIKLTVDREMAYPSYVATALYAESVRAQVLEAAQGVAQQKMSLERFEKILVPLPPRAEQEALLTAIGDVEAALKALSDRQRTSASRASLLEQAALAKAFRGELVPQDPDDEPASVLLERIRAARAAEPERGRRRGRPSPPNPLSQRERGSQKGEPEAASSPLSLLGEGSVRSTGGEGRVAEALMSSSPLSASAIVDVTGLDAGEVKKALKALVDAGQVRVEGKARGTRYVWSAGG